LIQENNLSTNPLEEDDPHHLLEDRAGT